MKIDMHVHTKYSIDGKGELSEFIKMARKKDLSGLAITDHNTIKGALKAKKMTKKFEDFVLIVGEEVSTTEGHVLAYNIQEQIIPGLTPAETIELIEDAGGFAAAAHPGRTPSGIKRKKIRKLPFKDVESLNASSLEYVNKRALKMAVKMGTSCIGGSDGHKPRKIGRAYTEFEGDTFDVEEIEKRILGRESIPRGKSIRYLSWIKLDSKILYKWLSRGGKDI